MNNCRHLISIRDLENQDLRYLVSRGAQFIAEGKNVAHTAQGKIVGIYFLKTSTRTRTAFSSGSLRIGAQIIAYGPNDLQVNTGETTEDTVRVLSSMLDALVIRTAGCPEELRLFASQNTMSVINAMSRDEHPTQAIADLTTMQSQFKQIEGLRVLYIGEGNNTAASLALALARFKDVEFHLYTPPGYGLDPKILAEAKLVGKRHGALIIDSHSMRNLPTNVDVVYTTRWQTTGTTKADPNWRATFAPFRVNEEVMAANARALFMHDLPAHREEEVVATVLDGPQSIAFEQAKNKLYSAMAVVDWCLNGPL